MYDWLTEALDNSGAVVTANRRLARLLRAEYAALQQQAGRKAWTSPDIESWPDWLQKTTINARQQEALPTRINAQQSQWLWEQCWRQELGDQNLNFTSLVRLSRDAWQRLADWQLGLADLTRSAQNDNQRTYAAVAGRYLGKLNREHMVDDAGMGNLLLELIERNNVDFLTRYTFAGFDRQRPIATTIQKALASLGIDIQAAPEADFESTPILRVYENSDSEFRAAGAWARRCIDEQGDTRIAIIANDLETDGDRIARAVREGVTPGWQYGHRSLYDVVNVSYGRRLSDYPAISVALILLRWLVGNIPSRDVSLLLRSSLLGAADIAGRDRIELALRKLPERAWEPSMLTSEFRGRDENTGAKDFLSRIAEFSKRRRELPLKASPADWAIFVDQTLEMFAWPGPSSLDSDEFQLINRWRELLNEFARLAVVSPTMTPGTALARLELLASETIFQPESTAARVQLIGPLEAAGAQFDAMWITGLSSANWPPAGSPSVLVSRRLQEKHGMPDSTPEDTAHYADRILSRLLRSAAVVECSYASSDGDAEQTESDLLRNRTGGSEILDDDPGWHATHLTSLASTELVDDRVPDVGSGEIISGGAAAIQNQMSDPVTTFVVNRMHAKRIHPQAVGIPAPMRGNLIHDALYQLYMELPSSDLIASWSEGDLKTRIDNAINYAFKRHEKNTDSVLHHLLTLERDRLARLLHQFVASDSQRDSFTIESVEGEFEFIAGNIRLPLRFDRVDRYADDTFAILDYKTGSKKRLLNRDSEAQEYQLFVYASAMDAIVSALALVNIDSREISFDGAGRGFTNTEEWPQLLQRIKEEIAVACEDLAVGDVRINIEQGLQAARPLNLLTRYTELRRDLR